MSQTISTTGLRQKSILIVDDNSNTLSFHAGIAKSIGLDAVTAASLKESIALCERRAFDVAVVDKCLNEMDRQNRDGIILLKSIAARNEHTRSILLTGLGEYTDATEVVNEIGAGIMEKQPESPQWEIELRERVAEAASISRLPPIEFSAKIFCGDQDLVKWESEAKGILRPPELRVLTGLLDELAFTLVPVSERYGDKGLQPTPDKSAMIGLYWSRGVGEAVAVLLAYGEFPHAIPKLANWPPNLDFLTQPMYQTQRKAKGGARFTGAIIKCDGLNPADFPVPRT